MQVFFVLTFREVARSNYMEEVPPHKLNPESVHYVGRATAARQRVRCRYLDTEKPRHDSKMGLQLTPNPHQYLVLVLPIAVGLRISVSFLDLVFGPILGVLLGSRFETKPPLKTGFTGMKM